jgi:DNA invertase Pin-like site-specific DNA recombinase
MFLIMTFQTRLLPIRLHLTDWNRGGPGVNGTTRHNPNRPRRYVEARGWTAAEYVDRGVSGAKDRRPALDALMRDAKRRRFDVLVCWRLDRLVAAKDI